MKTKKVTMHYCDHCSKKLMTRNCMEDHELICLGNPARGCKMCGEENEPLRLDDFDPEIFNTDSGDQIVKAVIKRADELQDCPCPACILSIFIQSKPEAYIEYDYQKERDSFLSERQEDQWEAVGR